VASPSAGNGNGSDRRLLLVSPPRPFGRQHGDAFSCQTNAAYQLTWAQGPFRIEDLVWHWGLDLMAANLRIPTTVLHFPTRAEFRRELHHKYSHIGFTFNPPTWHKVRPLVEDAQRLAPHAMRILGGYGAGMPEKEFAGLADAICREEGIAFMRRLLGEPDAPLIHPCISIERRVFGVPTGERTGVIFGALGCPHGCEFCLTSHFHNRRKIYFHSSGKELAKTIVAAQDHDPRVTSFSVFDEDFLVDEARARDFLAEVERSGRFIDLMIFSSVNSLSRFTPEELARMGIARVWIGYESPRAGYHKQEGQPFAKLCRELKSFGISLLSSAIVGYDHQTEAIAREEFDALLSTRPTAVQVMLFSPCFGTPAWRRLQNEGRLIAERQQRWSVQDGYTQLFRHPHMSNDRLESLVMDLYRLDYERLGPSMFRFLETVLEGHRRCRNHPDAFLRLRAAVFGRRLQRALSLFPLGIAFAPNDAVRSRLSDLRRAIEADVGPCPASHSLVAAFLLLPFLWVFLRHRAGWFTQPRPMRTVYR